MRRLVHIFIASFTASFALAGAAVPDQLRRDLDPQTNAVLSDAPRP